MGKINLTQLSEISSYLAENNQECDAAYLIQFANLFLIYREASISLAKFGAIVVHPKNGAPIENPYLKIQITTGASLRRMGFIVSTQLYLSLADELVPINRDFDSQEISPIRA